jgi:hypothetical protein
MLRTTSSKIILALWITIGLAAWLKPFIGKQTQGAELWQLWNARLEERRSIVYGREFYAYLQFCQEKIPPGATFQLLGPVERSLDFYRAAYCLYPHLHSENPDCLLIYKDGTAIPRRAQILATFSPDCLIIKNPGARQP